jgi:16S rRNA (cytidine1402-2'-O)-methyltransferase
VSILNLVPTPIGNLEDITLRAISVLKEVDYILAEDTRTSGKLLKHHGIENKLRSFHTHNEHRITTQVIEDLQSGLSIAMVSDAGTPGISDPAFLLVRACYEAGIQVSCLPGATALIPAVAMSGFPMERFHYEGFLPHKKGRKTRWEHIAQDSETIVLYESPHRLLKFLKEASQYLTPGRMIAVIREISKIHESVHRGTAEELLQFFAEHPSKVKGEVVVVLERIH